MNNYIKLLLYLKQFEGDALLHPVEQLFPDMHINNIKSILTELSAEGLIKFEGREEKYSSVIVSKNLLTGEVYSEGSLFSREELNSGLDSFKAMITFKGSKHLKEELQMQESGKYNISVTGQGATNNIVIDSQNVSINNKIKFESLADKIINTLKHDSDIDDGLKAQIIDDMTIAKSQFVENGKVSNNLIQKILEYGSNISSIGQLVLGLFSL
ncbi:MAG: hypothetical protein HYZ42_09210 [Bacteroidetes bacterium]|nr:hypothetical protein [Bacteroidota bacterium]